jgi:hypothetical protein
MYERPRCRYRDSEGSRFFRAQRLSPEETWEALGRELARVLDEAQRAFWRQSLRVDPDRIRWWHGAIFGRLFPHEGGRFHQGPVFFGVVMPDGGLRQLEGAPPSIVRRELAVVCWPSTRLSRALIALVQAARLTARELRRASTPG